MNAPILLAITKNGCRLWRRPDEGAALFCIVSHDGANSIAWDDPGDLVNMLVKNGVVVDHQAGFKLLWGEPCGAL